MAKNATIIKNRYDKKHMTQFLIKYHNENDVDIIEKLKSVPNKQDYIRQLVRNDIRTCSVPKTEPKNLTVLHENSKGIRIVREDYKNRSKVCVLGLDGTPIRIYRFNNVPEYKHPYLSWENLDHCGGWASDDQYLLSAVNEGKKPAAQYYYGYESVPKIKKNKNIEVFIEYIHDWVLITRTCFLKDLFDIDSIIDAYKKHDIFLDKEKLMPYMERPIMDLMKEKFFLTPASETEIVITGLMLGYPIESTASILCGY